MPSSHMTALQAYDVLYDLLPADALDQDLTDEQLVRRARIAAHPDRHGGEHALHDQVLAAAAVLGVHL